jgi:hypothetical protein
MKSLVSLIVALLVLLLLFRGGWWLYQKRLAGGPGQSHEVMATSTGVSLTLQNATHFVLTVTMQQGTALARFQLAPGKSETRSFPAGTYNVKGSLSDPQTDPFSSQWTFQNAGKYNATFARDGQGIKAVGGLIRAGDPGTTPGNSQGSPSIPVRPNP